MFKVTAWNQIIILLFFAEMCASVKLCHIQNHLPLQHTWQHSFVQSGKVAILINYYSAKSGLPEKILILVLILEVFPNSDLELGKSFSYTTTSITSPSRSISLPTYTTKGPGLDVGCKPW